MTTTRLDEELRKAAADLEAALAADRAPRPRYRDQFGRLMPWWRQPEAGAPTWLTPGREPPPPADPDRQLLDEARRLVAERRLDPAILGLHDTLRGRERLREYVAAASRGPRSLKDRLYTAVRAGRLPGQVLAWLDTSPEAVVERRVRAEYPGVL